MIFFSKSNDLYHEMYHNKRVMVAEGDWLFAEMLDCTCPLFCLAAKRSTTMEGNVVNFFRMPVPVSGCSAEREAVHTKTVFSAFGMQHAVCRNYRQTTDGISAAGSFFV